MAATFRRILIASFAMAVAGAAIVSTGNDDLPAKLDEVFPLGLVARSFLNGDVRSQIEDFSGGSSARGISIVPFGFLNDFFNMLVDLFLAGISNVVLSIVGVIDAAFAGVISALADLYVKAEPPDFIPALIAYTQNLVLERLVAVVAMINVDSILRANEYNHEFSDGSVKSYDSNQLASNNPIEDTRSEAKCLLTTGLLLGVFDGHGGAACAQVIAKRLYHYITACLLPPETLQQYLNSLKAEVPLEIFKSYNDKVQFVDDVREVYHKSFAHFLDDLSKVGYKHSFEMSKALEKAFLRLDEDLSREALPDATGQINLKTLSVAMTGSVGCVSHVDGPHLHIANVGDCNAVLGVRTETNSWVAKKLTHEHNTYNQSEVDRILREHPSNETNTVIKMERLLGQLAPLRAIGDFRYKWSRDIMSTVVTKHFGEHMIPPNYYTPPYLTAKPEVIYHRLTPRDKFLVLATDGLWDIISPLQVVRLVGEHMSGKVTLSPLKLPRKNMTLNEINEMLLQRKEGLKTKPKDTNAATHLIRNALGGTEYGIDHGKLSQLLSLPEDVVRVFRDDITITVMYFDSEYLRHCPA